MTIQQQEIIEDYLYNLDLLTELSAEIQGKEYDEMAYRYGFLKGDFEGTLEELNLTDEQIEILNRRLAANVYFGIRLKNGEIT